MDISASAFNLQKQLSIQSEKTQEENAKAILKEQRQDEQFREIIVSCTSLSHYESRRFKTLLPQILAALISASFHIVVGLALAYSAVLIPELEAESGDLKITKNQGSWIASIIVIVVPVASLVAGFFMDWIGRLNTLKMAVIPVVIGWILIALAKNVTMVLVGRCLTGLVAAFGTSPAIVYITEISRADMRGSLISSAPAYASLGMVLAYLKGWFMDWRTIAWMCNVYTIVPGILIMFIPESPAWLISKGKIDQARKSLEWIHKYQPQPENKSQTMAELHLEVLQREHEKKMEENRKNQDNSRTRKLKAMLRPTGYKPLLILFGLFFFQQFSGIYITLFYAITFFKEVGSEINPYLASVFIGTVRFAMSLINTYMLKTFHRRPLVMVSAAGMAACMFISGLYTMWIKQQSTTLTWVPVVFLILYVVASMIGFLPIPWTMTAELFPLEIRGTAHSIAYGMANVLMFSAVQSYHTLDYLFGGAAGIQWFFAVVSLAGLVYTFIFLPETHGKKLSDIVDYFVHNTIYLGQCKKKKKKSTEKLITSPERKPIVKNSRISKDDVEKSPNGQSKMLMDDESR